MNILTQLPPEVRKGQLVSLDFEMFDQVKGKLHRPVGTFAAISIAIEGNPNVYQLYDHHDLRKLVPIISKGSWVIHNALYDLRQFRRFATIKPRFIYDTMLMDQSMQGGLYRTFGLDDLSRRWLGESMNKEVREDFITAHEMTPRMKQYAAKDAVKTLEIAQLQIAKYTGDPAFQAYLVADEPMIFPVLDLQGFRVDVANWRPMIEEFMQKARDLEDELGFNVNSKAQVLAALAKREKLHLPNTKKATLLEYSSRPLIAAILEARTYRKAVSSYGMKWLESSLEDGDMVYSNYKITGAETGRMSSSDPNMQNIPQRKLPIYRSRFLASEGNALEIWDVSQQEPSITAYHSRDRKLLEALNNHISTHLAVAAEIYDNPKLDKNTHPDEYKVGKEINLGLTYGLTAHGLSKRIGKTLEQSEALIRKYFMKFSGVKSYIDIQRDTAYRRGYVTTALGRRIYINPYDRSWENNAINAPIQGGAADFTKVWGRKIWEGINAAGLPQTTNGFIHDETTRDTPKGIIKESGEIVQAAFDETAEQLYKGIPFTVEKEYGKSWAAKSISGEMIDLDEEDDDG